jgi:hypothetical protein
MAVSMQAVATSERRGEVRFYVLPVIPIVLALIMWGRLGRAIADADTPRYLANDPMRTATYPLFLDVIPEQALLPFQLLLLGLALAWLAAEAARLLAPLVATLLTLGSAANPYVWELQATIMAEAITLPCMAIMVGCGLRFALRQDRRAFLVAALLAGLTTSARSNLLPLLGTVLLMAWLVPGAAKRARLALLALALFSAPVIAERLYSAGVHGERLTSPLGRNLYMKAAIIDGPATPALSSHPLDQSLAAGINEGFAPVRALLSRAPPGEVRNALAQNYEACAGYPCAEAMFRPWLADEAALHERMKVIAVRRLGENPLEYLRLSATEYRRHWLLHPRKIPEVAERYNAFVEAERPMPFADQLGPLAKPVPAEEQKSLYRLNRLAFNLIGLASILATVVLAIRRRSRLEDVGLALLLGLQGVLVLSAFLGAGLPRYTMGLWPFLVPGLVFAVARYIEAAQARLR